MFMFPCLQLFLFLIIYALYSEKRSFFHSLSLTTSLNNRHLVTCRSKLQDFVFSYSKIVSHSVCGIDPWPCPLFVYNWVFTDFCVLCFVNSTARSIDLQPFFFLSILFQGPLDIFQNMELLSQTEIQFLDFFRSA